MCEGHKRSPAPCHKVWWQPAHAHQGIVDDAFPGVARRWEGEIEQIAATAMSRLWAMKRAVGRHPVRRGLKNPDHHTMVDAARRPLDGNLDAFARQCTAREDCAVGVAQQAPAAGDDGVHHAFDQAHGSTIPSENTTLPLSWVHIAPHAWTLVPPSHAL